MRPVEATAVKEPVGRVGLDASVKMKGHDAPEDFYFLVKEPHCKGHEEPHEQTVAEFRAEQGVEPYDNHTVQWIAPLYHGTQRFS